MTKWKLVPVEPTDEMEMTIEDRSGGDGGVIWAAVLSASPPPGEDVVERVARIMSDADDKQTGMERCKHMIRAVLKALEG